MQPLVKLYRRLDQTQRTLWFRIAATVLALGLCGGGFGFLLAKSYDLDSQRQALTTALANQNINHGDELALSLKNTGEVVVNGRRYGGPAFLNPRFAMFDSDGNIIAAASLADVLLDDQRPAWAPDWLLEQPATTWMLAILFATWLLLIVWMEITLAFALTVLGTAIPVTICWLLDWRQWLLAAAGIGLLTFTFVLLTRAWLILLNRPHQVLAVAHTVIKEASRRGIALVFIVLLLAVLPLLPLMLNPESPLRFRIQTFISLSVGLTFTIAAVMTLFFSCASVAFEIRDRQIWQLMTKPLARLNYLLGKWLGVLVIDFIILAVAGVSTFTFIQYLRTQPVASGEAGQLDALAVQDEVLTARVGGLPDIPPLEPELLRQRIEQIIQNDPELSQMESVPLSTRLAFEQRMKEAYSMGQRAIPPGAQRDYTFTGLQNVRRLSSTLTLRYRFHILRDDDHQTFKADFQFLDEQDHPKAHWEATYVPAISHSIPVPTSMIREDGTMKVRVVNLYQHPERAEGLVGALNFEEKDFELLYKVGNFESNFVRAMLMVWIKLAFLAALGIGCSTFLSFPVACLLAFTVFFGGMLGPFLAEALEWYYPMETSQLDWSNIGMVLQWAFESFTRNVALVIVFLLSSFGEYRPTQDLVEGRLIQWTGVLIEFSKLGLLWSGLSMIIGYIVLRRRQLAIYSGQG